MTGGTGCGTGRHQGGTPENPPEPACNKGAAPAAPCGTTKSEDERDLRVLLAGFCARLSAGEDREEPVKVEAEPPPQVAHADPEALQEDTAQDPGAIVAVRALLAAAMRACDAHGDDEAARQAIRADVLATPPELRDDLPKHFIRTYGPVPKEHEQPQAPAAPLIPAPLAWKPLHDAYMAHAQHCTTCTCAGRGYGKRCAVGLSLWSTYSAAVPPATPIPNRRPR